MRSCGVINIICQICRDKAHAARELLNSKLEERFHRGRSARISMDSDGPGNDTDESVISVADIDNEEE